MWKYDLQIVLAVVGILIVSSFLPAMFMLLAVFGTSIWAAVDSSKIDLYKYQSGIAIKPIMLFLGGILLWIVVFPWYLSARYKITNGLAELKDQYKESEEETAYENSKDHDNFVSGSGHIRGVGMYK